MMRHSRNPSVSSAITARLWDNPPDASKGTSMSAISIGAVRVQDGGHIAQSATPEGQKIAVRATGAGQTCVWLRSIGAGYYMDNAGHQYRHFNGPYFQRLDNGSLHFRCNGVSSGAKRADAVEFAISNPGYAVRVSLLDGLLKPRRS
jgi:hypothetical protein